MRRLRARVGGFVGSVLDRRTFLLGTASMLAGCTATTDSLDVEVQPAAFASTADPFYRSIYRAIPGERFPVPAVDVAQINPKFLRQRLPFATYEQPGTIIVDPDARFLHFVLDGGQAIRYGVGVGREGFGWNGRATILRKSAWPSWTPTAAMIRRDPKLRIYANGMEPGLNNPLGARALYLYQNGIDTLYRIHGTNEPWSIGRAASSGCIRLFNQDIIDLYDRTPIGTEVVVLPHGAPAQFIQSSNRDSELGIA